MVFCEVTYVLRPTMGVSWFFATCTGILRFFATYRKILRHIAIFCNTSHVAKDMSQKLRFFATCLFGVTTFTTTHFLNYDMSMPNWGNLQPQFLGIHGLYLHNFSALISGFQCKLRQRKGPGDQQPLSANCVHRKKWLFEKGGYRQQQQIKQTAQPPRVKTSPLAGWKSQSRVRLCYTMQWSSKRCKNKQTPGTDIQKLMPVSLTRTRDVLLVLSNGWKHQWLRNAQ
jgi:hypothetical protein